MAALPPRSTPSRTSFFDPAETNARLNSIHNRFRGCIRDTRAETFAIGSDEFRALELYVASRGMGLSVEGVAVRN